MVSDQLKRVTAGALVVGSGRREDLPRCQACEAGAPAAIVVNAPGERYYVCATCIFTFVRTIVALSAGESDEERRDG